MGGRNSSYKNATALMSQQNVINDFKQVMEMSKTFTSSKVLNLPSLFSYLKRLDKICANSALSQESLAELISMRKELFAALRRKHHSALILALQARILGEAGARLNPEEKNHFVWILNCLQEARYLELDNAIEIENLSYDESVEVEGLIDEEEDQEIEQLLSALESEPEPVYDIHLSSPYEEIILNDEEEQNKQKIINLTRIFTKYDNYLLDASVIKSGDPMQLRGLVTQPILDILKDKTVRVDVRLAAVARLLEKQKTYLMDNQDNLGHYIYKVAQIILTGIKKGREILPSMRGMWSSLHGEGGQAVIKEVNAVLRPENLTKKK